MIDVAIERKVTRVTKPKTEKFYYFYNAKFNDPWQARTRQTNYFVATVEY